MTLWLGNYRRTFQLGASGHCPRVGMARCAFPACDSRRNEPVEATIGPDSFRRLTLRSATGTAQRAIPTSLTLRFGGSVRMRSFQFRLSFGG